MKKVVRTGELPILLDAMWFGLIVWRRIEEGNSENYRKKQTMAEQSRHSKTVRVTSKNIGIKDPRSEQQKSIWPILSAVHP